MRKSKSVVPRAAKSVVTGDMQPTRWHFFGMYGMMPFGMATDPYMGAFCNEVKAAIPGMVMHDSPYRDYAAYHIAAEINMLAPDDGVFVAGTSLGANNCPLVASQTRHIVNGLFGFQASNYGMKVPLTHNVAFAHLFSSDNPIPLPGLGSYRWERGAMTGGLILQTHNVPHPGDYVAADRAIYIREMKTIISHTR
jgi:hypothetical protein